MTRTKILALAFALGTVPSLALAQPDAPGPKTGQAPTTLQDSPNDSLSTKLDKSGGVISPKGDVDPGMKVPAPMAHPNSMPVIPPATTGGETAK